MLGPLPPGILILAIFAILLLLPVKLQSAQLKNLAFFIWLAGGIAMSYNGIARLNHVGLDSTGLLIAIAASAIIGIAKGKFVLSKTSDKNIERLNALTEPQKPLAVYSKRSWIVIGIMALIAVSLTIFGAPDLVRGCISLGIGMGLAVSSLRYVQKPNAAVV